MAAGAVSASDSLAATLADSTACIHCDLLMPAPALAEGERADCPRCGGHLAAVPRDGLKRSFAFALSAVFCLVIAVSYPFLTMQVGGFENVMTLPQAALELYRYGMYLLSGVVLACILLIPTVMLALTLALIVALERGLSATWLVPAARLVFGLGAWSMVEVFVIGVIVSLVKLTTLATIVLGISFWAYAAFSVCLTAAMTSLDRAYIWGEIERALERE